jgi:MFS family permease
VTSTSALLLALSAMSGLSLPAGLAALLAVLALAAAAAFIRREARTRHPLIPVRLLRSPALAFGLAGAACGYLALFGPLVLIPQVLGLGIIVPANNTVIMRGAADSSASLVGGLVSMARGIGTAFGISLIALAWHLGSHSYQAGNPAYSGSEQARPAFVVLAVVAATAAAIALASGARPREPAQRPREGSPSGADH